MLNFSIIICTYNRCLLLRETITSVLSNVGNVDHEIIIIDNNSSDDTENVVRAFPQVKYVKELQQGLSFARNRGIVESANEILVFLDDDVELGESYFAVLTAIYKKSDVTIVGGKVLPFRVDIPDWLEPKYYYLASVFDLGDKLIRVDKLMGANYTMRREVAKKVGYYNVKLGRNGNILAGGEEVEYLNRARALKYSLIYDPTLIVYHKVNEKLNSAYLLAYSYEHGKSDVLVDLNNSEVKLILKIIKSFIVNGIFKISTFNSKCLSQDIKNQYFRGYRIAAFEMLSK